MYHSILFEAFFYRYSFFTYSTIKYYIQSAIIIFVAFLLFPGTLDAQEISETVTASSESESVPIENTPPLENLLPASDQSFIENSPKDTNELNSVAEDNDKDPVALDIKLDTESSIMSSMSTSEGETEGVTGQSGLTNSAVSDFYGLFQYSYPINIPPGRNRVTPNLQLEYSSSGGSDTDQFGYGWSINIPYIERQNKYGSEQLYTGTSSFFSLLSGELVQIGSSTEYRAKIERGDFLKYKFDNNVWIVTDKQGNVYIYGSTTASRRTNPADADDIYTWMLNRQIDSNGNSINYTYYTEGGVIYPDEITYTGDDSTSGLFKVKFYRELKNQAFKNYEAGYEASTTKRISEIRTYVDTSWVRKYELNYISGDNGKRDLLDSITETGRDNSITKTLPSTDFTYNIPNKNFDRDSNEWGLDEETESGLISFYDNGTDGGYRLSDINGDGLLDIIRLNSSSVFINDGDEFVYDTTWSNRVDDDLSVITDFGAGVFMEDINGDRLPDFIISSDNGSLEYEAVYIHNGSGWSLNLSYTNSIPEYLYNAEFNPPKQDFLMFDANGDGLTDLVNFKDDKLYLNNGKEWFISTDFNLPSIENGALMKNYGFITDINGDGLVDVVASYENKCIQASSFEYVYLNNGVGWETDTDYASSLPGYLFRKGGCTEDIQAQGYRFTDVNSDGLPDIVYDPNPNLGEEDLARAVYINNGKTWVEDSTWNLPSSYYFEYKGNTVMFGDIDGDSLQDFIFATGDNATQGRGVFLSTGEPTDVMSEVETPLGGTIGVSYVGSAELGDQNGNRNNPNLPLRMSLVDVVEYDNQEGSVWSITREYNDGEYYYSNSDVRDRKFAGFGKVTVSDDLASITRYFHQYNGVNAATSELTDSEALIGMVYRTDVYNDTGELYRTTYQNITDEVLPFGNNFVFQSAEVEINYDGDSDYRASATAYEYSTSTGNLTLVTSYGEVIATSSQYTDIGSDKRENSYTYASNIQGLSLVSSEILKDSNDNKVKEVKFYYDNQSFGDVIDGNVTKQENWVGSSTYTTVSWTYNSYGLPTQMTDSNGNDTNYIYDIYNLYIATTTDSEGLATYREYDYSSGKPTITIKPNGQQFKLTYDELDRNEYEQIPNPQTGSTITKTVYDYLVSKNGSNIQRRDKLSLNDSVYFYSYLDGFGRVVQEREESEDANTYIVTDYEYGDNGLLATESLPYFDTSSSKSSPTTVSSLQIDYTYDALERVTQTSNVFGNINTVYDQWSEEVVDLEGNKKSYEYDAYGRLIEVSEYNGSSTYSTGYSWNTNDNLVEIKDAFNNIRGIEYDALGRRVALEDLHSTDDNTYGIWNFKYDLLGNIATSTDPNGNQIVYRYDKINRLLSEDYVSTQGVDVLYSYDNCTNGTGFLCEVSSQTATTSYAYDKTGNIASETVEVSNQIYTTEYEFDLQGNVVLIVYPDSSEVQYVYNDAGLVEKVEQRENGGVFSDVISDIDYAPTKQIASQLYSNSVLTENTYDEDLMYRLIEKETSATVFVSTTTIVTSTTTVFTPGATSTIFLDNFEGSVNWSGGNRWQIEDEAEEDLPGYPSNNQVYHADYCKQICYADSLISTDLTNASSAVLSLDRYVDDDIDYGEYLQIGVYVGNNWNLLGNWGYNSGNDGQWNHEIIDLTSFLGDTITLGLRGRMNSRYEEIEVDNIKIDIVYNGTTETIVSTSSVTSTTTQGTETVQQLQYDYDSVGNITQIVDVVGNETTAYEYDDLYRLTRASSTNASSTGYVRTYSYNPLGNITNKSDQGTYTYQGNTGTNYANPHAATNIAGVTYTYDNNGNLASTSAGIQNTWNYRNELIQSVTNTGTTSYGYDHTGQRVWKDNGTTTTHYVSSLYEVSGTSTVDTITKHIYAGDMLVATIEGSGPGALTYFNHLDHLNSTRVVTNGIGQTTQVLDYYPFGDTRIDNQYGTQNQTKRYTGYDFDEETNLSYAGARYQSGTEGRFISQDPVALEIGNWKRMYEDTAVTLPEYFRDPQRFNTYAYAGNNPIKNVDKNGKDYYEFAADISIQPYSVSASLKFDPQKMRLDASFGAGPAGGASAALTGAYNPSELPNESSYITQEAFVSGGYYLGGKVYLENQPFKDGSFSDVNLSAGGNIGVGTAMGLSTGVQASYNQTLFDFSKALNYLKGILGKNSENTQVEQNQNQENTRKKEDKDNN